MENENSRMKHIETRYWAKLVICHPELEKSCPWDKLSSSAWHDILLAHPEFIRHAPKKIPQSFMTINQWLEVLLRHPELDEFFPAGKTLIAKSSEAIGKLWGELLSRYPQFAKYAPWKHLRRDDWVTVLSQQPQFIGNYEKDRMQKNSWIYNLNSSNRADIIACQPSLVDHFNPREYNGSDWKTILCNQPQFYVKCDFGQIEARYLGQILKCNPQWLPRCDTYSKTPREILDIASNFPEIFKHYDLDRFKEIGGRDTPWIEEHPSLVSYTKWRFSYAYWDGLLTRLSEWMETKKRLAVSYAGLSLGDSPAQSVSRGGANAHRLGPNRVLKRPLPPNPKEKNLRNSLDSIMDFRFWLEQGSNVDNITPIPQRIRTILKDENLSYEQLMLKMSMMPEEDCGMIFYGLFIQERDEFVGRMFDEDLAQVIHMVPLQYLLPVAIMYDSIANLNVILMEIWSMDKNAIANFRDANGNNLMHYAFFRSPWRPEERKDKMERSLFQNLQSYGVSPDDVNNMGYSYRHLREGLENYLLRS